MRAYSLLILLLLNGCASMKTVSELQPMPRIEIRRRMVYLPQYFEDEHKIDSLKIENHLLRVEIDYLKEKLAKLESLHKIKSGLKKLDSTIEKIGN